ncbi:hypothetical protein O0550_22675 [Brevibacillus halotolerans]|uniref:hypothetical protein n=1 Tax=Brevibacillus TaxID=55080 RepID=UPI00215D452A|nr:MULTISPECIES: hypothetical protein [Brevibacillus]MCR8965955.1 hypothetical protein [Brevibacillus laterosporus]MCZ0838111.1 hypothetical protein [Brevibacillus halotolerans]
MFVNASKRSYQIQDVAHGFHTHPCRRSYRKATERRQFKRMTRYQCELLNVSRSGYYNYLKAADARKERARLDAEAGELIRELLVEGVWLPSTFLSYLLILAVQAGTPEA